ncbi:MAG: hypothetical protein HYZ22_13125 [Chloroflexi bacterium]|nr:hypothetical protein [Chloroflexota bacterium]
METLSTAATTVIIGITVYALSQILTKFIIEPIYEQRKAIGEIIDALVFYSLIYQNSDVFERAKIDEVANTLRQKGSNLRAKSHAIPGYIALSQFGLALPQKEVNTICKSLNVICFLIYDQKKQVKLKNMESSQLIYEEANKIFTMLKFPSLDEA